MNTTHQSVVETQFLHVRHMPDDEASANCASGGMLETFPFDNLPYYNKVSYY